MLVVGFIFQEVSPLCTWEKVHTHAHLLSEGGGVWLVWDWTARRRLQSKAHPEPSSTGVWAAQQGKGRGVMLMALQRERVESRVLTLLLSQFDMVFGVFCFFFFF